MTSRQPDDHAQERRPDGGWWALSRPWLGWTMVLAVVGTVAVLAGPANGQNPSEPTSLASTRTSQAGAGLYGRNCAGCHGNNGEGSFRGPSLIGVGAASADYWLRSGKMPLAQPEQTPRRGRPAFDDAQIRDLVAYVSNFGEGPPIPQVELEGANLAQGGQLFRVNCASCHNWDGKGGALVNRNNAPTLHPVPPRQIAEAMRIGPGAMPSFTTAQLDDEELNDVIAYVDYMKTPQDRGGFGLAHWGPSTETVAGFIGLLVLVLATAWLGERRGR